ncbi:MAG: serine hydrolase [Runella slithyformis]|nr:MAG: serine hydrolase [Runella slithyformis]TAF29200.1 MAG: serine hydrolase [Runella slithyformis]TAF48074.1 MAG: serine hydrolase [Runella slithyformis]TAF82865.1 MAG: serine hydrolase [Runella slithyformis]
MNSDWIDVELSYTHIFLVTKYLRTNYIVQLLKHVLLWMETPHKSRQVKNTNNRKKMKKIVIIIVIISIVKQLFAQQKYSQEVSNKIAQVENGLFTRVIINGKTQTIYDRMKQLNIKGLSIAIVNDYKIEWAKGYGFADEKEKRKVDINTLFEPGSISKSINALGALKLVQNNKININADINTSLKSWKFPYDSICKDKKITLANLLSHTAGLNVHGFMGYDRNSSIPSLTAILDGKSPSQSPAIRSSIEPNKVFQYSGGGTTISQLMIEDASNQPYHKYMQENVLKPLDMNNSFFNQPPPNDKLKQLATGYDSDGNEIKGQFHVYPTQAAAGLWTTPTDLAKYMIDIQLSIKGQSNKVVNKDFALLHTNRYLQNEDVTMGSFRQERNGEAYFFHDAANDGFRGLYFGSIEGGKGVVVFVNSDIGDVIYELLNTVANVYNWQGFDKPEMLKTIRIDGVKAKQYEGIYTYEGKIAEVNSKKDGLYYWTDGREAKMHFTTITDFINIEYPSKKKFVFDDKGNVVGFERMIDREKFPNAKKINKLDSLNINEEEFDNYGMYLLESKRFDDAIKYLTRGSILFPNNHYIKIRIAHGYLFKNEVHKAIDQYKLALNNAGDNSKDVQLSLQENFSKFSLLGFDSGLMNKIKKELKF